MSVFDSFPANPSGLPTDWADTDVPDSLAPVGSPDNPNPSPTDDPSLTMILHQVMIRLR